MFLDPKISHTFHLEIPKILHLDLLFFKKCYYAINYASRPMVAIQKSVNILIGLRDRLVFFYKKKNKIIT